MDETPGPLGILFGGLAFFGPTVVGILIVVNSIFGHPLWGGGQGSDEATPTLVAREAAAPTLVPVNFDSMSIADACEQALGWINAESDFQSALDDYQSNAESDLLISEIAQAEAARNWLSVNGNRC